LYRRLASGAEPDAKERLLVIPDGDHGLCFFVWAPGGSEPVAALRVDLGTPPAVADLRFARCFARAFHADLDLCATAPERPDLWTILREGQFRRAIADFLHTPAAAVERWLRAAEQAVDFSYEGRPVRPSLVFFRAGTPLEEELRDQVRRFPAAVSVGTMLTEPWIRSVVDGRRVALVGDMDSERLVGLMSPLMLSQSRDVLDEEGDLYAPHESLALLQAVLGASGIAMIASQQGDLFVLQGREVVFYKAQGRWRYVNYGALHRRLEDTDARAIVSPLLRAAIDLSFERKGALFVVMRDPSEITRMVADHGQPRRASAILRDTLAGIDLGDRGRRQMVLAAAATDGAVVLGPDGRVLDVACMIAGDEREHDSDGTLVGARSLAARRASRFGVAVKVSSDGPITVYAGGRKLAQVG
jgi:hypothetical protein